MSRQRITWALKARQEKTAEHAKQASPPPQIPAVDRTEPPDHPAYYPDPARDKYEKGDTSAWAEDPHTGEKESPPPAMPGNLTTEPLTHPGTSEFSKHPESPDQAADAGGGGGKKASDENLNLREMAERRAALAVRIATAMMPNAETSAVEERALELMNLDENQLRATIATLKIVAQDDDDEEVVEEDEEDVEVEGSKKAATALNARMDRLENSLGKLVTAMGNFFGMEEQMDEDKSQAVVMTGPDEKSVSEKELLAFLLSAEDMDGDGVDQNDPRYGYSEKKSEDQDEFERGEESEGTKEFDEEEGDDMSDEDKEGSSHYANDTERMLKALLSEMSAKQAGALEEKDVEPLAKGPGIQSGEGGNVNPDPAPVTPEVSGPQTGGTAVKNAGDDESPTDNDIQLTAGADPMGLVDDESIDKQANDELLALYQDLDLPKTAADDQDEESDEDEDIGGGETEEEMEETEEEVAEEGEKEGGKKAASEGVRLRPQEKKASAGAKTLGNVQGGMTKEARNEINELTKLWESAPDVSSVFGVPRS